MKPRLYKLICVILSLILAANFTACRAIKEYLIKTLEEYEPKVLTDVFKETPKFADSPYVTVNNNKPIFSEDELSTKCFEEYSKLDELERVGVAFAILGKDTLPTEDRGDISNIRPTGWHPVKYDIISGGYLYNRCHLIGYQLTGENANVLNLMTGTRYMNVEGMRPFEDLICDYILETNNHVAYRVTPVFIDDNMLASGVQMEAYSIEDEGNGVCFNIYCFNAQPGIAIDYKTGDSCLLEYADHLNKSP